LRCKLPGCVFTRLVISLFCWCWHTRGGAGFRNALAKSASRSCASSGTWWSVWGVAGCVSGLLRLFSDEVRGFRCGQYGGSRSAGSRPYGAVVSPAGGKIFLGVTWHGRNGRWGCRGVWRVVFSSGGVLSGAGVIARVERKWLCGASGRWGNGGRGCGSGADMLWNRAWGAGVVTHGFLGRMGRGPCSVSVCAGNRLAPPLTLLFIAGSLPAARVTTLSMCGWGALILKIRNGGHQ